MTQDRKTESARSVPPSELVLTVADLTETIDFFTRRLGFCLDMIVPADSPRTAVVSGQGVRLRLEASQSTTLEDSPTEVPAGGEEFIIRRMDAATGWMAGRAGMQYRDLIPGRMGGRFIASHIRICEGGETPDYVHYHKVQFQMIFCKTGQARVIYEDQGPPFVLEAGDCILQPPEMRHRVLHSSAGFEVIEVSCPAAHETWSDRELELPTREVISERLFGGQRFVRHRASAARWIATPLGTFDICDTGIAAATNGFASVRVMRSNSASASSANVHSAELLFLFILRGELGVDSSAHGIQPLHEGDSIVIPQGIEYTLRAQAGLEMLEVRVPAQLSPNCRLVEPHSRTCNTVSG